MFDSVLSWMDDIEAKIHLENNPAVDIWFLTCDPVLAFEALLDLADGIFTQ